MALLSSILGPSKDDIWSHVAQQIGGRYEARGLLGGDVLRYRSGEWEIALDSYSTGSKVTTTYTRMRAPFVRKDGLSFSVGRAGWMASIGKVFGMQDIEIGDPGFDDDFFVRGNNDEKIRRLFDDSRLKHLIRAEPDINFRVRADAGLFDTPFPKGIEELYFERVGILKDEARLKNLFALFALTLEGLVRIESIDPRDPGITL